MSVRVCVIGSSYIGALYKAYKAAGPSRNGDEVDFYGRGAGGFRDLKISNGHVCNARFRSRQTSLHIREYDAFVIYGDLPGPHDLVKPIDECRSGGASGQLVKALVKDIAWSTATLRLARGLGKATDKPVLILSSNVAAPPKIHLREAGYDYIASLLRRAVAPYVYVPFPRELFTAEFRPDPRFYQRSLDIRGEEAGTNARRDRNHMNELGGRLILDTILDRVNDALHARPCVTETSATPSATSISATALASRTTAHGGVSSD